MAERSIWMLPSAVNVDAKRRTEIATGAAPAVTDVRPGLSRSVEVLA